MKRVYKREDIDEYFPKIVHPELWTAIIPAAGRGTRLKFDKPKILFPIAGKLILDWLVDLLSPFCKQFVFILSPTGKSEIEPILEKKLSGRYKVAIQEKPSGMGDAILIAEDSVTTKHSLVIWGDQVGLEKATIEKSVRAHEHRDNAKLTCPTILTKNPYIHFQRDSEGCVIKILQAREEPVMPDVGENDCGLFLLNTNSMFSELHKAKTEGGSMGYQTGEFNFLPIFPRFDNELGNFACLHIISKEETIGVNTMKEAEILSKILEKRVFTD